MKFEYMVKSKDNKRAWIKDRFPPIQPGGKHFSIDVTILLFHGGRTKAIYDHGEGKWKSARDYATVIPQAAVKGWRI